MSLFGGLIVAFLTAGILISTSLLVYTHRNAGKPAISSYRNLLLSYWLWGTFTLLYVVDPGGLSPITYKAVADTAAVLVAVTWFIFIDEYTRAGLMGRRWVFLAVWSAFVATVLITSFYLYQVFTGVAAVEISTYHGLTVTEWEVNPVLIVHLLHVWGVAVAGFVVLARFMFRTTSIYYKQAVILFLGGSTIFVGSVAIRISGVPHPGLDLGPVFQTLNGVLIWAAIYRFDFISLLPLARDTIVDTIDDPVVVLDDEDAITYANDAATQIGVTSNDFARSVGSAFPDLSQTLGDGEEQRIQTTVQSDGSARAVAETRVYDLAVNPIVGQHGLERGRVVVFRDVTEQTHREERLEQFASIVSHDLRNPINVAQGHLEIIREERGDDEHVEAVDVSLTRMRQLIDELLKLAQEGYDDLDLESLRLEEVAVAAWENVDTGDSALTVTPTKRSLVADEHLLAEVLENCFRNAIEHNEGPVEVRVERTERGFAVEDDGVGIPPEERDAVLESGYTTNVDGTGYGLHIVDEFASAHGWAVTVTESGAGGARFEFDCS